MACETLAKDAGAHADEVILLYLDMLPDYVSLLVLIKGVPPWRKPQETRKLIRQSTDGESGVKFPKPARPTKTTSKNTFLSPSLRKYSSIYLTLNNNIYFFLLISCFFHSILFQFRWLVIISYYELRGIA